ncbi:MAG: response regulator [Gemmatimonadota bacterium]|nr:response regulator [Gemmatimonadota bacterium]
MKKILVIDDLEGNRDIFTSFLEDRFEVLEAGDGAEGLKIAERELPDMIFMDVSMPAGMGGLELIEIIRKHAGLYHIPVIAITAHSVVSAKKAVEKGCNDFLLKPLTPHKIEEKISQWIDES